MQDMETLVTSVLVGIVTGVVTWWITRTRERLHETRQMQRDLLTQLISNRHDLNGDEFTRALNGCAVVFADSDLVQERLRAFHHTVTAEARSNEEIQATLLALVRGMISHLDLKIQEIPDEFWLIPINTRPGSRSIPE